MLASLAACAKLLTSGAVEDPALVPWQQLRYEHVRALAAVLATSCKPATQQVRLGAVRRMIEECWKLGLVTRETVDLIRSVRAQKRDANAPLAGRVLEPPEQRALFRAAEAGPGDAAARDTALLALALYAGMRREEISELPFWDGELGLGYRAEHAKVVLKGKGGKIRSVELAREEATKYFTPWLSVRGPSAGPFLWCLHAKSYHAPRIVIPNRLLSPSAIYATLDALAFKARIKDFSPHDLRRTFITELLEAGVDVFTVARMAGHDDPQTTMRYDRRGEKAQRAAAEALAQYRKESSATPATSARKVRRAERDDPP